MNKPFLLIAGDNYYPSAGTGDWIGFFETREEILEKITDKKVVYQQARKMGNKNVSEKFYISHIINEVEYNWYEIVDIREWMK